MAQFLRVVYLSEVNIQLELFYLSEKLMLCKTRCSYQGMEEEWVSKKSTNTALVTSPGGEAVESIKLANLSRRQTMRNAGRSFPPCLCISRRSAGGTDAVWETELSVLVQEPSGIITMALAVIGRSKLISLSKRKWDWRIKTDIMIVDMYKMQYVS